MTFLTRMRPSNLIILAATPFIIWLFATVPNYQRSLIAIVGIEDGAGRLFLDFLVIVAALAALCVLPFQIWRGRFSDPARKAFGIGAATFGTVISFMIATGHLDVSALVNSITANAVDPVLSDLVVKAVTPRQLTPEAVDSVGTAFRGYALWFAVANAVLALGVVAGLTLGAARRATTIGAALLFALNGLLLIYLLLTAHLGFASGLFTTLRCGVFAYILAGLLGVGWAGMLHISPGPRTTRRYAIAAALMLTAAAVLFFQPHSTYVLAGALDKKVAITKGTPKSLVDQIRFGEFDGAPADREIGLRSSVDGEHSLRLMSEGTQVSAVFLPEDSVPDGIPVLWKISFLPGELATPATALVIAGILLGLLTISAYQHKRHPLSVGAEFFVDTVRGIPMLVIILFIGLPLAGALKDMTGGAIDPPNTLRGVVAIAVGYSAYMAEIFRAGIEAVPRSQTEAARSLGLNNWQLARLIILPQALKIVIPPLGNEFIAMLKDTSLLSILSVRDVTQRMREFQSASFLPFAPFNSAAILYVFLTLAAASLIGYLERKHDVGKR